MHALFNGSQIILAKGGLAIEIIIKAVFDRRPDGDLRFRIEFQNRLGHHMRRIMADGCQNGVVLAGDQRQRGVSLDDAANIPLIAINHCQHGCLGKAGPDIGSNLRRGYRRVIAACRPVWKCYRRHEN